jgi:multisubunit Na+/H+ antiporter MnhB subunit
MISEFSALSHARQRKRTNRRRIYIIVGLLLIALGYALMAVKPDVASDWVLARAFAGMGCLVIGFGMAVLPLLSSWTSGD